MSDSVKVYIRSRNNTTDGLDALRNVSTTQLRIHSTAMQGKGQKHVDYSFDQVYMGKSKQKAVYETVGQPLLRNILNGYNSTLFVYGQTGSGKTYTMFGPDGGQMGTDQEGIVPRQLRDLFSEIAHREEKDDTRKYEVSVSIVDIYLERVRDLLNKSVLKGGPSANCKVRYNKKAGVYIQTNENRPIDEKLVHSYEEVQDCIEYALKTRRKSGAQAKTSMNAFSSRSHLVIQLKLKETTTDGIKTSKLLLCDLAGSEKVKNTNAVGTTLKQAQNINYGLSVLGNVLNALTAKVKRLPPFTDSKLTKILQDALGGNSKTSLICGVRPDDRYAEETRSTLRFGSNAKKIKNQPVQGRIYSIAQYKKLTNKLETQIGDAIKTLKMTEQRAAAFQNWASALEQEGTKLGLDLDTVAEKHGLQTVDEIIENQEKLKEGGEGMSGSEFLSSGEEGLMFQPNKRASSIMASVGGKNLGSASKFQREMNARLQVQNDHLKEDIEDLRNRIRSQGMHIEQLENENEDMQLIARGYEAKDFELQSQKAEIYRLREELKESDAKNHLLENALERSQRNGVDALKILSYGDNMMETTKKIFAAIREQNMDAVNTIVIDQSRELEKLRSALDNHKQMNQSLVLMRKQDAKIRQQTDSNIIQLYTTYMHAVSQHDNEMKKRDDRIARLEKQLDELKEQRSDLRKQLTMNEGGASGSRLSIADILKKNPLTQVRAHTLKSAQRSYVSKRIKPRPRRRRSNPEQQMPTPIKIGLKTETKSPSMLSPVA